MDVFTRYLGVMIVSEYIKKEDATKSIKPMVGIWADDGRFYVDYQRVLDIINNEPAADVVEVRHGRWIGKTYKCSLCGKWVDPLEGDADMNYFPNCGAKMG